MYLLHFRAQSGQATTETTTEVIFVEQSVINVVETGVIENTTERTTIKCQASGKPRPTIQLNLFEDYGPNLMRTGLYQVFHSIFSRDILHLHDRFVFHAILLKYLTYSFVKYSQYVKCTVNFQKKTVFPAINKTKRLNM